MRERSQDDRGTEGASVRSVGVDRWKQAQEWELAVWRNGHEKRGWKRLVWPVAGSVLRALNWRRAWGDDWNHWWKERFDDYRFLPERVGDYAELGCGPYTNTRVILEGREATRVVCSDPLVRSYVTFRGRWLAEAHRAGRVEVDDHPIEELPFPAASFDTVVMINVLDHVRDADACMRKAVDLVRPGGYLVLGQDLSDEADIAAHPYDVGHPIRLQREDIDPYLEAFETVHRRDLTREEGRDPRLHYSTLVYAGRKREAT
jgi:SAM-dependent methyltransferase